MNYEDIMDEDIKVLRQLKKLDPSYKLSDAIIKKMRLSYGNLEKSSRVVSVLDDQSKRQVWY